VALPEGTTLDRRKLSELKRRAAAAQRDPRPDPVAALRGRGGLPAPAPRAERTIEEARVTRDRVHRDVERARVEDIRLTGTDARDLARQAIQRRAGGVDVDPAHREARLALTRRFSGLPAEPSMSLAGRIVPTATELAAALADLASLPSRTVAEAVIPERVQRAGFDPELLSGLGGNLVRQIPQAAQQLGPGLITGAVALGTDVGNPRSVLRGESKVYEDVLKPAGESYAHTYGPLFRGDPATTAERISAAPLGPALDVLGVATLGGGAVGGLAARGALGASRRSIGEPGRRYLRSGELEVSQPTSPNPVTRALQEQSRGLSTFLTGSVEDMIGRELPVVSEHARTLRAAAKRTDRQLRADEQEYLQPLNQAIGKAKPEEALVAPLIARRVKPSEMVATIREQFIPESEARYADQIAKLERRLENPDLDPDTAAQIARAIEQQQANLQRELADHQAMIERYAGLDDDLYENPSKATQAILTAAARTTEAGGDVLEALSMLDPAARAARPYLHARIVGGGRVKTVRPSKTLLAARDQEQRLGTKYGKAVQARDKMRGQEVGRLQTQLDKLEDEWEGSASARRPRTPDEAKARLAKLSAIYTRVVSTVADEISGDLFPGGKTEDKLGRPISPIQRAQALRNRQARRQIIGGQRQKPFEERKTAKQEAFEEAERRLFAAAETTDDPTAKAFLQMADEMSQLERALASLEERGSVFEGMTPVDPEELTGLLGTVRQGPNDLLGRRIEQLQQRILDLVSEGAPNLTNATRGQARVERMGGALSAARDQVQALEQRAEKAQGEIPGDRPVTYIKGGPKLEQLQKELPGAIYFPDLPSADPKKVKVAPRGNVGTSQTPAKELVKRNQAIRVMASKYLPEPEAWSNAFVRTLALAHSVARREIAMQIAKPLSSLDDLERGNYYLRVRDAKADQDWQEGTEGLIEQGADLEKFVESNFATRDRRTAEKWRATGHQIAQISGTDYRQLFGSFAASTNTFLRFFDRAQSLWRAMTLNWRPAWMVNNVVGQNLLYALNNASPRGARSYAWAVGKRDVAPAQLRFGFYRMEGTSNEADTPIGRATGTVGKLIEPVLHANHWLGEANSRLSDELPRRAAFHAKVDARRNFLNRMLETNLKTVELVDLMAQLPTGLLGRITREGPKRKEIEAALAERGLDPKMIDRAIQLHDDLIEEVLTELVDFGSLSNFERQWVRRFAAPFWSWMKGIMRATGHIAIEHPVKARMLVLLGEVGAQAQAEGGLDDPIHFLRNLWPIRKIPGARRMVDVLTTGGLNPIEAATSAPRAIAGFVADPGELAENPATTFSPLVQAGITFATNREVFSGREAPSYGFGRLGRAAGAFAKSFPQTRVAESYASPDDGLTADGEPTLTQPSRFGPLTSEAARYLGVPVKRISLEAAERIKEEQADEQRTPEERAFRDVGERRLANLAEARRVGVIKGGEYPPEIKRAWDLRAKRKTLEARAKIDDLPVDERPRARFKIALEMLRDAGVLKQPVQEILDGWKDAPEQAIGNERDKIIRDYLGGRDLALMAEAVRANGGEWDLG
jgi:hypothetical protein